MLYVLLIFIAFILIILYSRYQKQQKHNRKKALIIAKWGKPFDTAPNFKLISAYYNNLKLAESDVLSDSVALDIDLENVFKYIDRTNSKPAQQYLYQKLRTKKTSIDQLTDLDNLSETLTVNDEPRIAIELELSNLNDKNAYYIQELFTTAYTALYKKWLAQYIKLAGILWVAVVSLTIIFHSQVFFLLAIVLTLFNFYLHYTNKQKISSYIHSLPQLYLLVNCAKKLLKLTGNQNNKVVDSLASLTSLQRSLTYVNLQGSADRDPTDIAAGIWELVKTLLVIEPLMFLISINKINKQQQNIANLFYYIAEIDVAISIKSLRISLPYYCKPTFVQDGKTLTINELYHPLIENCIPNSISLSTNQGVLITGSNMSGKTTFIRSIAINALLAQTLFTSCTSTYETPCLQLFSSIRISDDLKENKSYFQSEALSILDILKNSSSVAGLIIIDEIFRGTNTIERVAAAKAILSYLIANQNFTLVSTHDLELAELLGNEYSVYSFEEQVSESRLVFDYKIKPGILKNKNAIAILAALGYPDTVIENARHISKSLNQKYSSN